MDLEFVLKKPFVTEKTTRPAGKGSYGLEVDLRATKKEIKRAVEKFLGAKVKKVNTVTMRGKKKKLNWKKAIIQLKAGEKIDIFEEAK